MSRTYKATGINLKSMPMGESDRLLTILTREYGLVRAIAMGSRKYNSSLGGRSGLFVVNQLLIARGRSLDKITQAETLESYPGLGQDLKKLTASQYLAELALYQALSDQPQEDLFTLLNGHLKRLERSPVDQVLAHLTHALFQLLVLAGVAPQVHLCCVTQQPLIADLSQPDRQVGFSVTAGGTVTLAALERLQAKRQSALKPATPSLVREAAPVFYSGNGETLGDRASSTDNPPRQPFTLSMRLNATELNLLQQLAQAELPQPDQFMPQLPENLSNNPEEVWRSIEQILRHYAQYHFDRPIRSAALIDSCFAPAVHP
jgi:DNA repair protein RecO (recombination protein O)